MPSQRVGATVRPLDVNPVRAVRWSGSISTTTPHAFGSRWRADDTHTNEMPDAGAGLQQRHQPAPLDRARLVDDDEHGRQRQPLAATAALGEQVVDDRQRVVRRRRQLRAAERAGVGQPLEERPVVQAALADEGDDGEVRRALHRRRLHHERAGQRPRRVQRPGDADAAVLQDVDGERHVVEDAEAAGDLPRPRRAGRGRRRWRP